MNDFDLAVPLMDGPSYDRACSLVPSEYVEAWEWFLGEEQRGGVWTSLPHHTKEDSPQYQYRLRIGSDFFPVTRDSGIFWPGQDRVKQDPDKIFALSVHNSKKSFYTDVPPLYLDDGTWVIKYGSVRPGLTFRPVIFLRLHNGRPLSNLNPARGDAPETGRVARLALPFHADLPANSPSPRRAPAS